ncbi:hypothetical protein H6P81_018667 [Aristolochia fimbriata]|uniref:F-box protein n=1 Tax=Aristolochia fimbriata TaxID=158543 RepID=A0AAV7E2K8_ARIFI|nr:hypothetical protein H6P81_018667 [Aristolochia fimbriata]
MEILLRVSKKSRCRCKRVSKEWLNLIISAKSSSLYSSSTTTTTWGLVFKQLDGSMTFCRLDEQGRLTVDDSLLFSYAEDSRSPYTIGSCNGLLYFCGSVGRDLGFKIRYFLDNPVTKQSSMLPELPILEDKPDLRPAGLGLTFDDDDIDASNINNWKLVAFLQDHPNPRPSIKSRGLTISVFDSRRWAWKKTRPARFTDDSDPLAIASIPPCTFRLGASSIHIDGALHWVWNSCLVLYYFKTWSFRSLSNYLMLIIGIRKEFCGNLKVAASTIVTFVLNKDSASGS